MPVTDALNCDFDTANTSVTAKAQTAIADSIAVRFNHILFAFIFLFVLSVQIFATLSPLAA